MDDGFTRRLFRSVADPVNMAEPDKPLPSQDQRNQLSLETLFSYGPVQLVQSYERRQ